MQRAWLSRFGRWAILLLSSVLAKFQGMVRAFMVWIISAGPIPSHIAFIMDGNRRFADRLHVDRRIGHSHGYDALLRTLKDCFDLQVKIVTLFAFSIDNFQRHPDEVRALMDLMQSKLETLVEKQGLACEYGIRVQVLGDLRLLPEGARLAAEKAMAVTRQNNSVVLNLCVSYTSTHEIVQAIQRTRDNFLAAWDAPRKHSGVDCHKRAESKHDFENVNDNISNVFHNMKCVDSHLTNCEHNLSSNSCNDRIVNPILHKNVQVHVNGNGFYRTKEEINFSEHELSSKDCIVAELSMQGRDDKLSSSSLGVADAPVSLRNCMQKKARVSESSKFQDLPSHSSCSCDMQLCTAAHADHARNNENCSELDPVRNKCTQSQDLVHNIEHDEILEVHEAVCSCSSALSMPFKSSSNPSPSGNDWSCLHQLHSQNPCENEIKANLSPACNFDEPCVTCSRILKSVERFVSEQEIERSLYTHPCPTPDLLIRTSGETRLSNFLLWQTAFSHLAFCKVLWPEFSFRNLFLIILEYQRAYSSLLRKKQNFNLESRRHD